MNRTCHACGAKCEFYSTRSCRICGDFMCDACTEPGTQHDERMKAICKPCAAEARA